DGVTGRATARKDMRDDVCRRGPRGSALSKKVGYVTERPPNSSGGARLAGAIPQHEVFSTSFLELASEPGSRDPHLDPCARSPRGWRRRPPSFSPEGLSPMRVALSSHAPSGRSGAAAAEMTPVAMRPVVSAVASPTMFMRCKRSTYDVCR